MTDDLDTLLNTPLPDVADDRFSERVIRRLKWEGQIYVVLIAVLAAACVALVFALPQLRAASADLARLLPEYAGSVAIKVAAAALVITYLLDRQITRADLT